MVKSGATAAFRGYRLQTLYILSRLIEVEDQNFLFRPEGKEDLDIYSVDGQLLETVQVKAYSASLTLSNLASEPNDTFFDRSLRNRADFPDSTIRIVSFGPVGPEFEQAWSSEGNERVRVQNKLVEGGYTKQDIAALLSIRLDKVNEAELERKVLTFLQTTLTGGNSLHAFDLLMYWVCRVSEKREQISYSDVIDKLTNVGRYLEARSAYYDEWFTSILPLPDTSDSNGVDKQRLAQEYSQGVDARYEHILAGLDIVRSEKLTEIQRKFEASNVVIMHGASGQGKSTLAFRYLHDYTPNAWCFLVRFLEDRKHVLSVANALAGHAKAIDLPCIVYVDVSSSDRDWTELVRELSHLSNLRVLVTIREEDWRRATGYRARFVSEELELSFNKVEAGNLYAQLKEHSPDYLAFDEAWARYGGKGPLLEFVYFLTQDHTLKSRVESQIQTLENDVRMGRLKANELHLLRLVAVASAYEAKLDLKAVAAHLGLSAPSRTIEQFTKEYLIRVDESKSTVTGLHSVRSNIMLESLLDDVLSSWESTAEECLPLLVETDLEIFLLHAFSRRRTNAIALLGELESFRPKSWTGVAGILRALLWLGVRDYAETHRAIIDQEYSEWGPGWFFRLDSDLTGIAGDTISGYWKILSEAIETDQDRVLEDLRILRAKQEEKDTALLFAKAWLEEIEPLEILSPGPRDLAHFAQVLFWASHFDIGHVIPLMCSQVDFGGIIEETPINILADLIYAFHMALKDRFSSYFDEFREQVASHFRRETSTFFLEDDGSILRAHFIPDFAYNIGQDGHTGKEASSSTIHEETMHRVDLLGRLLPDRSKYGSQGYGHRMGIISPELDETKKDSDSSDFFSPSAKTINACFRLLGNYPHRPKTWEEHAQQIFELRKQILALLDRLQMALDIFFRKQKRTHSIERLLTEAEWASLRQLTKTRPLLPQSTVDEWGFTGEGITLESSLDSALAPTVTLDDYAIALAKHKDYFDILHKYLRHLSNFAAQSINVVGRTDSEKLSTDDLHAALESLNQLQTGFRARVGRFISDVDLRRLEEREQKRSKDLWCVWYQFAFHPGKRTQDAARKFVQERDDVLKRVKGQIRRKLKEVSEDEFLVSFARVDLYHEGKYIPCITIDISEPIMYWQAVQNTIVALQQALHSVNNKSLRYYTIQFWLKHIAVVPLIRGRALSRSTFVFPTCAIQSGSALEKWYWYTPKEISDEDWARLNVSLWNREQFQPALGFTEDLVVLSLHASQLGDLCRFPDDGYDTEVISKYLQAKSKIITEYLQRVYDVGGELLNQLSCTHIDFEKRPSLEKAYNILFHICQEVKPAENHDSSTPMTVDEIEEWSVRLEQLWEYAEQFKLLWITDVIDRHATED